MSYFKYQSMNVYYREEGNGAPVVFLHGDTASSKMFEPLLSLYTSRFKVILIDFLGNGRSDRVPAFPPDLWIEEGRQTVALLEHLGYGKVSLVGSSGGAWAAINAALLCPDLVDKVVADSFDGRALAGDFVDSLLAERSKARKDEMARGFYEWCQGGDWERVVDMNTQCLVRCVKEKRPLFVKDIGTLKVPLLLMGSRADTMVRSDFLEEYRAISVLTGAKQCLFDRGEHPAVMSNAEQAAEEIANFLLR